MPWKNGGGVTREIVALRAGDKIIWRLSIADVESEGPFSTFSGLTRILTVIEGTGISLISSDKTAGIMIDALYGIPVEFEGGEAINSKLINGKIRDLNVIFDAKLCHATVTLVTKSMRIKAGQTIAIIGLKGTACINNNEFELQFGDTVLSDQGSLDLALSGDASALVVKLDLRS